MTAQHDTDIPLESQIQQVSDTLVDVRIRNCESIEAAMRSSSFSDRPPEWQEYIRSMVEDRMAEHPGNGQLHICTPNNTL